MARAAPVLTPRRISGRKPGEKAPKLRPYAEPMAYSETGTMDGASALFPEGFGDL